MDNQIEILKEVKEVFDENEVTFWLDCGSLLGAVRDGKMIEWDHDFDLGLRYDELDKINQAVVELKDKGFDIYYSDFIAFINGRIPNGLLKNNCPIGLFIFPLNKKYCGYEMLMPIGFVGKSMDYLLWVLNLRKPEVKVNHGSAVPLKITKKLTNVCSTIPNSVRDKIINIVQTIYNKIDSYHFMFSIPTKFYKDLETIKFCGMDIKVPSPVEEYLEYRYGKDWRTPQRDFISYALKGKYRYGCKKVELKNFVWKY